MFLLVGGVVMLVVSNVLCQRGRNGEGNGNRRFQYSGQQLPDTYVDVFKAGMGKSPTLGTAKSTCWARGGICVPINNCRSLNMDVGVAGCSWGYMVCCRNHAQGSPTVGSTRRDTIPLISNLDELGTPLEIIALRNSMLLSNWRSQKSESDDNVNIQRVTLNAQNLRHPN